MSGKPIYLIVVTDPDDPIVNGHASEWSWSGEELRQFLLMVGWTHKLAPGGPAIPLGEWVGNPRHPNRTLDVRPYK